MSNATTFKSSLASPTARLTLIMAIASSSLLSATTTNEPSPQNRQEVPTPIEQVSTKEWLGTKYSQSKDRAKAIYGYSKERVEAHPRVAGFTLTLLACYGTYRLLTFSSSVYHDHRTYQREQEEYKNSYSYRFKRSVGIVKDTDDE